MSNAREPGPPIVDYEGALQRLGGDRKLFNDLARFFWDDAPPLLESIRNGLLKKNAAEIERAAHNLKGLSSNFGAPALVQCALEIEQLAHAGDLEGISDRTIGQLDEEVAKLSSALRQYCHPQS